MAEKSKDYRANPRPPSGEASAASPPPVPRRRRCGTMPVHQRLLLTNPEYVRARAASENHHREFVRRKLAGAAARTGITTIPVVVHVVFNTPEQNLSQVQIRSQIDVLNRDYRKRNVDVTNVPATFRPLVADAGIEFVLATYGPSGESTNGIIRTPTPKTSFADDDSIKFAAKGGADAWPADAYLNIWTAPRLTSAGGDLLGYAQFPGGPAATDGIVILHSAFGTTGTAAPPYNLGRTATHETGHWLNLHHIWGDDGDGCNGSDFVDDTPNQGGPNYGTPVFPHVSCSNAPNGDLFMNYMDYVDDVAMFMFTVGQVDRMQAALERDRSTIGLTMPVTPPPIASPSELTTQDGSMVWPGSIPEAAPNTSADAQRIQEYERVLTLYKQADAAGRLSPVERQRGDELYGDYLTLVAEYRGTSGG